MLGIVIGIAAVVAMVSLGQGAGASVQAEIASLGTNVLIIVPGATTVSGVRGGLGSVSTLTVDDAGDIEKKVSGVSTVLYATRSVSAGYSGKQELEHDRGGDDPRISRDQKLAGCPRQLLHVL